MKPRVIVDDREIASGVPGFLLELGAEVEYRHLDVADYIVSPRMAAERKAGEDLIASLVDRRLFEQAIKLKMAYFHGAIYIFERFADAIRRKTWKTRYNAIFGSMASLTRMNFSLAPTQGPKQTAHFIYRLAHQEQIHTTRDFTARSLPKRIKTTEEQRSFLLQGLYNTGSKMVVALLDEFETPENIIRAFRETDVLFTRTGNPKGIQGPLEKLREKGIKIGPKYVLANKKILIGETKTL